VLIGLALLGACSQGGTAAPEVEESQEETPAGDPADDVLTEVEPTWHREIAEAGGPVAWASHADRGYLAMWPNSEGEQVVELVALDLATGGDLWTVSHQAPLADLIVDERGGVIVVETVGDASTLTAYDEHGQQRWATSVDPVADEISSGFLHDPVAAFDLENDLVMIGSRAFPGILGLDLTDGSQRWHLQHESDTQTPLYAGTQLDRFGDALVAVDDFNAPSIAVLDLDDAGHMPTVRWHQDPGTGFGDGVIADGHGFVTATAEYVRSWDITDGRQVHHQVIDWHQAEPGAGDLQGRAFAGLFLFEDTIVIERDRRWVLDRTDASVRASYDLDGDGAVGLVKLAGDYTGAYGADALVAAGHQGLIARLDAQGHVYAVRADTVDADSTHLPQLLVGESIVVTAVKRGQDPVWDLWAIERSQLG